MVIYPEYISVDFSRSGDGLATIHLTFGSDEDAAEYSRLSDAAWSHQSPDRHASRVARNLAGFHMSKDRFTLEFETPGHCREWHVAQKSSSWEIRSDYPSSVSLKTMTGLEPTIDQLKKTPIPPGRNSPPRSSRFFWFRKRRGLSKKDISHPVNREPPPRSPPETARIRFMAGMPEQTTTPAPKTWNLLQGISDPMITALALINNQPPLTSERNQVVTGQ
ncbi:hypothetical protein VTJ83DRAFT_2233 [Remersonia thermophila]|uniref:Uncharacterized protein n=1 Tax=Remersonia thermophila TaxID=72144 RepID=A0ABR4DJ51_9PEZI